MLLQCPKLPAGLALCQLRKKKLPQKPIAVLKLYPKHVDSTEDIDYQEDESDILYP